jgi:hypothetical protein
LSDTQEMDRWKIKYELIPDRLYLARSKGVPTATLIKQLVRGSKEKAISDHWAANSSTTENPDKDKEETDLE